MRGTHPMSLPASSFHHDSPLVFEACSDYDVYRAPKFELKSRPYMVLTPVQQDLRNRTLAGLSSAKNSEDNSNANDDRDFDCDARLMSTNIRVVSWGVSYLLKR